MINQDTPGCKRLPVLTFVVWMGMLVVLWMYTSGSQFFSHSFTFNEAYTNSLFSRGVASLSFYTEFDRTYRAFAYVSTDALHVPEKSIAVALLEEDLYGIVGGYPIEDMVPFIAEQERMVVAFLVGIAKKESNWGKRVPLDAEGGDCYNYWGYRGAGSLGFQRLGYGCFASPEEAIRVVGGRIHELAIDKNRKTPSEMIIWKCGSSCAGHSSESVRKWISDVDVYYSRLIAYAG